MLFMAIILHIDLDAFYAACEEREAPQLRGKAVVIGADPKLGRGVVATANYEARKYGVRSGMPISKAYRLCPQAIYLQPNFELYVTVSEKIMQILRAHAPLFEQMSIDEAYLDVSGKVKDYTEAERFAKRIKQEIKKKEKLTCSVGVAPNKLVAKIASDFRKPDGLTIVQPKEVQSFLAHLPASKLPGVGKKTAPLLEEMGIETIGELARYNKQKLIENFGKFGILMHEYANGIDHSAVTEAWEIKSIGKEHTFLRDTADKKEMLRTIETLARVVHHEASGQNFAFKTVAIKLRYSNFETLTRQRSLGRYAKDADILVSTAKELFDKVYRGRPVRLVGVRVAHLVSAREQKTVKEFA